MTYTTIFLSRLIGTVVRRKLNSVSEYIVAHFSDTVAFNTAFVGLGAAGGVCGDTVAAVVAVAAAAGC